jgi:hypothetical protein
MWVCSFIFYTRKEHSLRELGKTVGHKKQEVTGDWRKFYKGELHDLYFSSNIIGVIKSGWMEGDGWGHVA